jgi:tRNA pseudouridine55 synthase
MFLAVDKPTWISSFGVIKVLKKFYLWQKIWHSGTLDPMATWLMILAIWKDTKNLTQLIWLDKSYITNIDFSKMSDTWDMEYWDEMVNYECEIRNWNHWILIDQKFCEAPSLDKIKDKLQSLLPLFNLPVPAFSAKKKNWKRSYELARKGQQELSYKEMKIYGFQVLEYNFPVLKISLDVWSGTYIRSIAYWLGQQFWLGWILTDLRRTQIWNWEINKMEMQWVENSHIKFCEISID